VLGAIYEMTSSRRTNTAIPVRWLLAAASVGLAVRLAFGLTYWTDEALTRDEQEYLSLARSLARGHGFTYDSVLTSSGVEPFGRAPGYPTFLALVGGGADPTPSVPASVQVAQSILGALGVLMVGLIAHRLAGRRAAVFAAAIASVYPPLVWIAGYALSEALFWPIGLLTAWLFDRARAHPDRTGAAIACGLALGIGTLIRPALVLFVPLAGLVLLAGRRPRMFVFIVAGLLVVVGPWTVRNYLHHGRLVFVASEGGVTFWTGNHPLAVGDGDMAANIGIKLDNQRLRAQYPDIGEEDMEPVYYREAFAWIRANPAEWLALELRKAFYLIVPVGPSYTLHSTRYYALSVLSYLPVLFLAVIGAVGLRERLGQVAGVWLLMASAVLVALVFFPQERFRIPIIDPSLVILAGAGLALPRRKRPS
jgi:4-amino-4-deoxy-L-arabinose transferase-like glycosyltransferase